MPFEFADYWAEVAAKTAPRVPDIGQAGGSIVKYTAPVYENAASTSALASEATVAENAAWSATTRAAWAEEELASIAAKNAVDKAEIAAARNVAAEEAFAVGSKVAGVVAIPFLAADVFDLLAPGVHRWLRGGWKGGSGVEPPGIRDGIKAGQCDVGYDYSATIGFYNNRGGEIGARKRMGVSEALGPIGRPYEVQNGNRCEVWLPTGGGPRYMGFNAGDQPGDFTIREINDESIVRRDGGPDNCPGPASPPGHVQNPVATGSPYSPSPAPTPIERPVITPFDNPAPVGYPVFLPNSPSPLVRIPGPTAVGPTGEPLGGQPATPTPYPTPTYLPAPRDPLPDPIPGTPNYGTDYRIKTGFDDVNKRLDDIADCACNDKPSSAKLYNFTYPIFVCTGDSGIISTRTLSITTPPNPLLVAELEAMASLAAEACAGVAPIAVPDYWQVRLGADRPIVTLSFRESGTKIYHSLSIPHPKKTTPWSGPQIGDYDAGPFAGIITLRDNSKIIVNAASEAEANRVLDKAVLLVDPAWTSPDDPRVIQKRKGIAVKLTRRVERKASYFPSGGRVGTPRWSVVLKGAPEL